MIKKLNICLFVIVLTILLLKIGSDALANRGSGGSDAGSAAAPVLNAEFSPQIVYETMVPFAVENPLTRRDGYILDMLQAIFPNARRDARAINPENVHKILSEDPTAVCISYGDHPVLREFPHAQTPLAVEDIALYTSRDFEWNYAGPDSLAKLRIGMTVDYEDSSVLMRLREALQKTDRPMQIFTPSDKYYRDPLVAISDGVVDAVALSDLDYSVRELGITSETIFSFNVTPAIDHVPLLLIVSNVDPEYAKRLIDAYEAGFKEIEASGRLRRIREYYQ